MKLRANPSRLFGRVAMPGSKSHTIRAVAIASLAEGESVIRAPLDSWDTQSAVACYRAFGARIETSERGCWRVTGFAAKPGPPEQVIDVGNSGVTLRTALASAALLPAGRGYAVFTGDEQIRRRPVGPLLASLHDLGAFAVSTRSNGCVPAVVGGHLAGGKTSIAAVTSQYLSSLLINTPLSPWDTEIVVTELNEQPFVQMTLDWLDRQQIRYNHDNFRSFLIPGGQGYRGFDATIPADFSSAAFFLCAGAIGEADIELVGLDPKDSQGDKAIIGHLRAMGADISVGDQLIRVRPGDLIGREIDLNATPDALPALAVVGAFARGTTRLVNVAQARIKESDRIAVMASELAKLGARCEERRDGLIVHESDLHGGEVNGHHDHRVVMALSLVGLAGAGPVTIGTAEAMKVTFPDYVDLMRSLGADLVLE